MVAELELSWSEVKTFQRCPKQWEYKYLQRLQPKEKRRAPYLGNWLHACLETYYHDGDWKIGHQLYVDEYNKLFDEEKEEIDKKYGPMPSQVERIIRSYLWYYKNEGWKVIATEQDVLAMLKPPIWVKGRLDLLVEDEEGLIWLVDHKSTALIPEQNAYHATDPQLMIYPWAIERMKFLGIKVAGVIYNYIKSRPPTIPKMTAGGAVSKRKVATDYPTLYRFLVKNKIDPNHSVFTSDLRSLQKKSPFLQRYRMPREAVVTKGILSDFYHSGMDIFEKRNRVEDGANVHFVRNITKDCQRMCSFHDLCRQELNGFDSSFIRKSRFDIREKNEELEVGDTTWNEYEST